MNRIGLGAFFSSPFRRAFFWGEASGGAPTGLSVKMFGMDIYADIWYTYCELPEETGNRTEKTEETL